MRPIWKLKKEDLIDVVWGAALLGAGGGGSPEQGLKIVEDTFENDINSVKVVEPKEVQDDESVAVNFGMGSPEVAKEYWEGWNVDAFQKLEETVGEKIPYVIPFEIGAGNSIPPAQTAATLDIAVVDGDPAGRAVPEIQMTTFCMADIPMSPMVIAGEANNYAVLYSSSPERAEEMGRAVTSALGDITGVAAQKMSGKEMKDSVISGTLTQAKKIGELIRKGKDGDLSVDEVVSSLDAVELARGEIVEITSKTESGFDYGEVFIGDNVKVDYKNENMIVWEDDEPQALAPDLICWLSSECKPMTNADLKEGKEVIVLGIEAPEQWRKPEAYGMFQRIHGTLGYEEDYVPLKKLVS